MLSAGGSHIKTHISCLSSHLLSYAFLVLWTRVLTNLPSLGKKHEYMILLKVWTLPVCWVVWVKANPCQPHYPWEVLLGQPQATELVNNTAGNDRSQASPPSISLMKYSISVTIATVALSPS